MSSSLRRAQSSRFSINPFGTQSISRWTLWFDISAFFHKTFESTNELVLQAKIMVRFRKCQALWFLKKQQCHMWNSPWQGRQHIFYLKEMVISYAKIFMKNWRSYETTEFTEKHSVVSKKYLLKSGTQEIRIFYLQEFLSWKRKISTVYLWRCSYIVTEQIQRRHK